MAGKGSHRRCVTCRDLSNCNIAKDRILIPNGGCSDWKMNEELARDAREEIEIEFGPLALLCLTPQRKVPPVTKRRRHVHRRQTGRKTS